MSAALERTPLECNLCGEPDGVCICGMSPLDAYVLRVEKLRERVAALEQDRKDLLDSIDHLDDVFDEFSRVAEHLFGVRHTMKERLRALAKPEGE